MAVSLSGSHIIIGVPGATSADGVGKAAAMALQEILPVDPVTHRSQYDIDEIKAGIGAVNGQGYAQQDVAYEHHSPNGTAINISNSTKSHGV